MRFETKYLNLILLISVIMWLGACAAIQPRAKADLTVDLVDMEFAFVRGGTFEMGSKTLGDEMPVHSVTIDDLYVGMYEVTFDQYDRFCRGTPKCEPPSDDGWGRDDRPVIRASWHDANAYSEWLSEQTGMSFRLPTEAEWEYFARAGTTTAYWTGDALPENRANCTDCGSEWDNQRTAPVGSFAPNPWRIYDTMGNVAEWTADDYQRSYEGAPNDGSANIVPNRNRKAQRGGAWGDPQHYLRSAARDYRRPHDRKNDTGFRLVLIPSAEAPLPLKK